MHFKLSDWIGLINWTHLLQSERHVQCFDTFVCSGVIKVKINFLIYCSTLSVFFTISHLCLFRWEANSICILTNRAKSNLYMMTSLMVNLKYWLIFCTLFNLISLWCKYFYDNEKATVVLKFIWFHYLHLLPPPPSLMVNWKYVQVLSLNWKLW